MRDSKKQPGILHNTTLEGKKRKNTEPETSLSDKEIRCLKILVDCQILSLTECESRPNFVTVESLENQ